MPNANMPKDYKAKEKRIMDAIHLRTPDRVPVLILNGTWGFSQSKTKIYDVLEDSTKIAAGCTAFCKDIYADAIFGAGLTVPFIMYRALEPDFPTYVITDDGYSFTHSQATEGNVGMQAEDYPELIRDPRSYFLNTLAPRRYKALRQPYPANYEALKGAYDGAMAFLGGMITGGNYAKKNFGMPTLASGTGMAPMDFLFDNLRGFKGISLDMRRRPEEVVQACDAIEIFLRNTVLASIGKGSRIMMPLHMPPYLGIRNFEKFYWPSFRRMLEYIISKQAIPVLALEGDWTPYIEYLKEFPRGSLVCIIDQGDFKTLKKNYGDYFAMAGGMPMEMLKYSTREECCDYAKDLINTCAPGGGYIFATDKVLHFANDVNPKNLKAVCETVRDYGKY